MNNSANTKFKCFYNQYRNVILLALSWLLVINIFEWIASERFELEKHDDVYDWINNDTIIQRNYFKGFINIHHRWDSAFYIDIAKNGYSFVPGRMSNVSFFPLYPILITVIHKIFGLSFIFSAYIISNLAVFFACLMVYKLFRMNFNDEISLKAIFYMLIFPGSFYFTVIYTESIYLLISAVAFYYILKKKWWQAGIAGMFCTLTRPVGFLILIPMFIEYLSEKKKDINMLSFLLIPFGFSGMLLYYHIKLGNAFAFFESGRAVGHKLGELRIFQFDRIHAHISAYINAYLDVLIVITVIAFIILLIKNRIKLSFIIYTLVLFFSPMLSMGKLNGTNRYAVVLFPLFIVPALLSKRSEIFNWIYTLISILLLGLYTILYVQFYWSG